MSEQAHLIAFDELDAEYGAAREAERIALVPQTLEQYQTLIASLDFDPRLIYCVKTGQPIGERNYQQIYSLINLNGVEKAADTLAYLRENTCAAHWLQTDGACLDKLRINDPLGYFIYASSYLVSWKFKAPHCSKQDEHAKRIELFNQKIATYQTLNSRFMDNGSAINVAVLHIANGHLRNFLSIDPQYLRLPFQRMEDIADALIAGNLYSIMQLCFTKWVRRQEQTFNLTNVWEKLNQQKGAGQFRAQRASNRSRSTDEMLSELAGFDIDLTVFSNRTMTAGQFAERMKYNETPAQRIERLQRGHDAGNKPQAKVIVVQTDNAKPGSFAARFVNKVSE